MKDKAWIERKKAAIDNGSFGVMFDADDALALIDSHEELRAVSRAAEDLAVLVNTDPSRTLTRIEREAVDNLRRLLRGSPASSPDGESK
jgi:hypothetical protein